MSSPATSKSNYIKLLIIVSGAISAAAGLFALYGWTGDNHLFTALIEGAPRLHFLPAVSFVIAGVSVVLTVIKRKTPAVILSYLLILIAVFEILHFAVGHQAGIDGFAVIFGFEESEFHMTLIGSLAFLFVGLAIAARWRTKKRSAIVSGSFGAFSLACGLGTLLAYSSGYLEHMKWNPSTELSIPGAVAFLVLGVAIIAQSSHRQMNLRTDWKHFVPVVLLVVGLTLSFVMRHYFHAKDVVSVQNTVSIELRSLSKTIESEINDRLVANERMARRWAVHGGTERPEWEKDAKRLYRDYGGYQAVEWVDPDYKVRWIIPFEPNKRALGLDLGATPNRLWAVKKAKETRKSVVSEPITLVQGGLGLLAFSPIYNEDRFMGFILGVINVDGFFSLVIPKEIKEHYTLLIDHQGRTVFASHGGSEAVPVEFYRSSMLEFGSRKYSIRLRPSTERVAELSDNDDDLSLVIGALLSLLVSGAVYLAQRARRHNRLTRQANRLLKKEIEGRKHAETVLRETSTFRKAILNGANFIIVSTDREGLITSYNRTAELLLGYAADEAIGNFSLDQFMLTEELENYSEELGRRFGYNVSAGFEPIVIRTRDRIADEREWTLKCKNGSHLPVELSVTAIIEEDNEITGYLAIGRDNSRLYNTSQRLQESEERFKAVVNNTPSLVYIKDKEGKFVFSNNKFEDLLELEPGCLIGKTAYDITDEETASAVREMEKRVLKTQRPEESVEVVKLPDGSTAHYMFVRFAIPTITREYCVGVIAVDISPQLAIEEELRSATTAAIESSRMKSEFLANMSHEIRTPMNGVLGMLEVLLDTPLNTSQREYADVIQDSAKSLLTILDDILDFSKLEAGKLAFETIEFDLRSTVENTVAMFADAAETKGIEISYLIERNVPTALLGDPGRFRQVLTNLVGNAVKFTEDGQITLTISEQESTGDSVKLKIDVEDTGIGITESAQKYLFDAFVQADGSMVRKYGGNGLGLSISKQLVELMKGEIGVKSEPGAGSRFTFTAQFNIQKNPVFKRPPVDLTGVKVLVADDLDTNRDSIVYQLQGLGIEAYQVPNGEECIELLFQHSEKDKPFDIVLIDQEMPGLTGFETAEIIKQNPKIMDTRVVIMPSHGRRGHAHDAIRSGISAYLIKPIRQVELFDCVTTMMVGDDHERNDDPAGVSGLITRHSLLEKRTENGMPILIASDDVSNQNVLSMQLELLGYRSEVVSDAAEVSSALKRRDYSLIFVDFAGSKNDKTATQIREYLKDSIVPLVGISEQRAKPRPGFNACISLPVSEEEMARTIERLMNDETRPAAVPQESDKSRSETPTAHSVEKHIEELIEELGEEIAGMTVSLFTEDTNRNISELRAANRNGDFDGLQELAASIAETAETVGAQDLIEICNEITASRRNGQAPDLSETVERLDKEFDRVLKKLERLPLAPVEAGV